MKQAPKNQAIIIGAGATGLLAAAALAPHFREVLLLEAASEETYWKQVAARARFAHVCAARALGIFQALIPGLPAVLRKNGFAILDPGESIHWNSPAGTFPASTTGLECGLGSYEVFLRSLHELVAQAGSIRLCFSAADVSIRANEQTIDVLANGSRIGARYDLLAIATGASGRNNRLLDQNSLAYSTEVFAGPCAYHSFEVSLHTPLARQPAFLVEARPCPQAISAIYVPLNSLRGILTIGNFGPDLELRSVKELEQALEPLRGALPADFLPKIQGISRQANFRIRETYQHSLAEDFGKSLYLLGDALLKVPPYTGLGLAVAAESLDLLLRDLQSPGETSLFAENFAERTSDIRWRVRRYQRQCELNRAASFERRPGRNLFQRFEDGISGFVFREALEHRSPEAARYLFRRFHLAESPGLRSLAPALGRIALARRFRKKGGAYAAPAKVHQSS